MTGEVIGRVALHFARAPQRGIRLRQVRGREIALRDAGAVRGLRRIEPLAGQRALFEQVLRAIVFEHRVGERRFSVFERRLGHRDRGDRGIGLRIDLAAVDRGNGLAHRHRIADVDQHLLDACPAASASPPRGCAAPAFRKSRAQTSIVPTEAFTTGTSTTAGRGVVSGAASPWSRTRCSRRRAATNQR